VLHALLHAAQG